MDANAIIVELAKYGPFAVLAGWLIWKTMADKDRMATELTTLNVELRQLVCNNTAAMLSLKDTMDGRPCLRERGNAA